MLPISMTQSTAAWPKPTPPVLAAPVLLQLFSLRLRRRTALPCRSNVGLAPPSSGEPPNAGGREDGGPAAGVEEVPLLRLRLCGRVEDEAADVGERSDGQEGKVCWRGRPEGL